MEDCIIQDSYVNGLVCTQGGIVRLSRIAILDTHRSDETNFGMGLALGESAECVAEGLLVSGTVDSGVFVGAAGAVFELAGGLIRKTLADPNGVGRGLQVAMDAQVELIASLVRDNVDTGILVGHGGSLTAFDSAIESTSSNTTHGMLGEGLLVVEGGKAQLHSCLVDDNQEGGIAVGGELSDALLVRTVVRGNRPNNLGVLGRGIDLQDSAHLHAIACLIEAITEKESHAGNGADTRLTLISSAVQSTLGGGAWLVEAIGEQGREYQVFGDGVFVTGSADLMVYNSLLKDNARCGVYYYEAMGTLSGSVVTGNESYGVAMAKCALRITHENGGNQLFGNALSLPEAERLELTDSPGGLPLPPPAAVAELP